MEAQGHRQCLPSLPDLWDRSTLKELKLCGRQIPSRTCSKFQFSSQELKESSENVVQCSFLTQKFWCAFTDEKMKKKNCLTKEHWVKTGLDHCHSHWIQHWRFSGLKGTEDNSGHHQPALELGDPPSFVAGIWVIQSLPNSYPASFAAPCLGEPRIDTDPIALRFRIECVANMYKNTQRATKRENSFNIFNLMVQMQVCGGVAGWYGSMICRYDSGVRSHTVHSFFWGVAVFLCSCNWET